MSNNKESQMNTGDQLGQAFRNILKAIEDDQTPINRPNPKVDSTDSKKEFTRPLN
jgi:hypothetical protein